MFIPRTELINAFHNFAEAGHGIVIGPPGIGKTFILRGYAEHLITQGIPNLYLPIDKLHVEDDAEIQEALGIKQDLISFLKESNNVEPQMGRILIIDSFDAARSDKARSFYISLIRRVLNALGDSWHVVVSVRTYDAKRSEELLDLFPSLQQNAPSAEYQMEGVHTRHFYIPDLTPTEISNAKIDVPNFAGFYEKASGDFKRLLAIPFNLWLVEKLVNRGLALSQLSQISSEVELLDLFWKQRVADQKLGEELTYALTKITRAMVDHHTLSVRRENVYEFGANEAWDTLLSLEVLEIGPLPANQRISFKHNILFDYAVAALLIEEDPLELERFLMEDQARPFFLRPSLSYYFSRLWHKAPKRFWAIYWHTLSADSAPYLRLFSRLLPSTIVVTEARTLGDLDPLLQALKDGEPATNRALRFILQAHRALAIDRDDLWIQFLVQISNYLNEEFIVEAVIVTSEILARALTTQEQGVLQASGKMSRQLMRWAWDNRRNGVRAVDIDALAGQRIVPLVAKTYATSPAESRVSLLPVLDLINEEDFPIRYLSSLTHELGSIWPADPEFALLAYQHVYAFDETSQSPTIMGGIILPLSSNRRQDYEMCRYALEQLFPSFLRDHPEWAFRAAIDSLNILILKEHVLRYLPQTGMLDDVKTFSDLRAALISSGMAQTFQFREKVAVYTPDFAEVWDGQEHIGSAISMANNMFSYLAEVGNASGSSELLGRLLDIVSERVLVAFFWKRLLDVAARLPRVFAPFLFELCTAPPILTGNAVLYSLGRFMEEAASEWSKEQVAQIEEVIIGLPSLSDEPKQRDVLEHRRNRLLARLPKHLLVTEQAQLVRQHMEASADIPTNEPLVSWSGWTSQPYTEEDWLKEQGVDLGLPENQVFRQLSQKLEKFSRDWQNKVPTPEAVESIMPVGQEMFDKLSQNLETDEAVLNSAWTHLAACAEAISRAVTTLTPSQFKFCRSVLVEAASHPMPRPNAQYDADYNFPHWSPDPRTEAAQGLPFLAAHRIDSAIETAVVQLVRDPVPSVRFLVAHNLWRISKSSPDLFWQLMEERTREETNRVAQQGLCHSLSYVAEAPEAIAILDSLLEQTAAMSPEVLDCLVSIVAWLYFASHNEWATAKVKTFLDHPLASSKQIMRVVLTGLSAIQPNRVSNSSEDARSTRILNWLMEAVSGANQGLSTLIHSVNSLTEEQRETAQELYRIIDTIVSHVSFAQKKDTVTIDQRRNYYFFVKPLLEHVLNFAQDKDQGLMLAPTAHHFMELLNDVLRYDPASVLRMASVLAKSSEPSGYQLDPLAVDEVVKLVETILADYRELAQTDASLQDLLNLLDIFAGAGWPRALQLVWRLDEVFR